MRVMIDRVRLIKALKKAVRIPNKPSVPTFDYSEVYVVNGSAELTTHGFGPMKCDFAGVTRPPFTVVYKLGEVRSDWHAGRVFIPTKAVLLALKTIECSFVFLDGTDERTIMRAGKFTATFDVRDAQPIPLVEGWPMVCTHTLTLDQEAIKELEETLEAHKAAGTVIDLDAVPEPEPAPELDARWEPVGAPE